MTGCLGEVKVSCSFCHRGAQLILASSSARPAILVAGKGRGGNVISSVLYFYFPLSLSFSLTIFSFSTIFSLFSLLSSHSLLSFLFSLYYHLILYYHFSFLSTITSLFSLLSPISFLTFYRRLPASVAQLDAPSDWRPGGRGFNPSQGRQHSFVEVMKSVLRPFSPFR